jgi:simple sugar transport system permease protein
MTAAATTATARVKSRATPEQRRATFIGSVMLVLAGFVVWVFGLGVESAAQSTFNLSLPGARFEDLTWKVDSRLLALIAAAIIAFLGGFVLRRARLRWTNVALAVGLGLFALSFLTWAAAGKDFSLVGMLRSTVILSIPVTLGALSGLTCERVAVINIAIEGQLLTAAFVGCIIGSAWGSGQAVGVFTGAILEPCWCWRSSTGSIRSSPVWHQHVALGLTSFLA